MARDEQALRDYGERMSAALGAEGFPRMPARVLMALTTCDGEGMTAAELSEQLGASPGAISGAVRYLQHMGMARRVSQPGTRRDLYELPYANPWYTVSMRATPMYDALLVLAPAGIAAAGGADTVAGSRIAEMTEFLEFVKRRLPDLLEEWHRGREGSGG